MSDKQKTILVRILAIILLLFAVGKYPYVYYQILRWVVAGAGIYLAVKAYEFKSAIWAWVFGITAVLFNPLVPFRFDRDSWQILDVVTAVVFLTSIFIFKVTLSKENQA